MLINFILSVIYKCFIITIIFSLGEEAAAAQAVARTAQAEAAKATTERDAAKRLVTELKTQLASAERAQDRLDALNVSKKHLYCIILAFV